WSAPWRGNGMRPNAVNVRVGRPIPMGHRGSQPLRLSLLILTGAILSGVVVSSVEAEDLPQVFQRVDKSVGGVRAKGPDRAIRERASTLGKSTEWASGVFVPANAKARRAAPVVQTADEITVEFLGGELLDARVVASEVKADLALLQLARVPAGIQPSPLGDS